MKLAARPFSTDPDARQDRFVHLTNPDVLKHDPTHVVSMRNTTHAPYRERLRAAGADPDRLWRDIRRIVGVTMMAARPSILDRMRRESIDPTNTFELLGFDVLVDADLRPWLLECNLGPSLAVEANETTGVSRDEEALKGRLVADALRLAGVTAEDGVTGEGARERAAAEAARCGGFRRVVPSPEATAWMPAFEAPRPSDLAVLRAATTDAPEGWPRLVPNGVSWHALEDGLLLYDTRREQLAVFGPAGALAWLAAIDGVDPESVARELAGRLGGDFEPLADSVWETVGGWIHQGWLAAPPVAGRPESPAAAAVPLRLDRDAGPVYALDGWRFIVRIPGEPHEAWIRPALAHLQIPGAPSEIDGAFEILAADDWAVVDDEGRETPCGEPLGVLPTLFREVERRAARARGGRLAFRATVAQRGDRSIVLLGPIDWPEPIEALRAGGWSVYPRERLLLLTGPERLVRFGDPSNRDLGVQAIVPSLVRRTGPAAITPIGSVAALAALLAADIDLTTWLDAPAAGAFAAWFDRLTRAVVTAGGAAEAASLLAGLLGAEEPSQVSS